MGSRLRTRTPTSSASPSSSSPPSSRTLRASLDRGTSELHTGRAAPLSLVMSAGPAHADGSCLVSSTWLEAQRCLALHGLEVALNFKLFFSQHLFIVMLLDVASQHVPHRGSTDC